MELIVLTKDQLDSIIRSSITTALDEYIEKEIREKAKPDFYTIKEAAEKLKVTETTIRNYIKKGLIAAEKIGGRIRIERSNIESALKEVKSLKYRRL
ncbi:helix-turn-helix domain-containing protein [Christiangramia aquimixticola]|uniref:helix-turn-helix domain-containing protein n=1 Tax=Christiangramia aquimixticola TaxID=1697558 RepID=UPI003AA88C75